MKANHECIVSLAHVTKYFDQSRPVSLWKREHSRIYALNDVSFTLRRGEFAVRDKLHREGLPRQGDDLHLVDFGRVGQLGFVLRVRCRLGLAAGHQTQGGEGRHPGYLLQFHITASFLRN